MAKKRIQGITIELDGETRGLEKALSDVDKQSRNLQQELRDVERLLKFDPGNVEALAQKQQLLTEQVQATTERLNRLRAVQQQVQQQFERGEIGAEQYRAFRREIVETENRLKSFESKLRATQQKVNTLGERLKEAGREAKRAGREIANSLGTAGAAGTTAVGGLVLGMQDFNRDLARLRTNADIAGRDLGIVEDAFKRLVAITGETDSAVETLSNLMATGFTDNQLAEAIELVNGAAIKFSDTLKTEGIADGIQETFATGEAVGPFAELLERSGIKLEDFNKKLQKAKKEGQGTQFILQTLAEQGFGKVAEKYEELNPEVQRHAEAQAELQAALGELAIVLTPLVEKVTEFLTKVIEWANQNPQLAKTFTVIAGVLTGLAGAINILKPIFTVIVGAVKLLAAAFGVATAKIWIIIGVIVALIAIGIALWKNWDTIKAKAIEVWGAIKEWLAQTWDAIKAKVIEIWNGVTAWLSQKWEAIKETARTKWESLKEAIREKMDSARTKIREIWDKVMAFFKNIDLFKTGKNIIQGLIDGIVSLKNTVLRKAKEIADGIKNRIKGALGIASPSKVMMGLGEDTAEGFAIGLGSMLRDIQQLSGEMARAAIPDGAHAAATGVGGQPNKTVNYNVNVNAGGSMITDRGLVRMLRQKEWFYG